MRLRAVLLLFAVLLATPVRATSTLMFASDDVCALLLVSGSAEVAAGLTVYRRPDRVIAAAPPERLRVLRWRLDAQDIHLVVNASRTTPRIELRAAGRFASLWVGARRYTVKPDWVR